MDNNGIFHSVKTYTYSSSNPIDLDAIFKDLQEASERKREHDRVENKKIYANLKVLSRKAKELNERPPAELVATIMANKPRGAAFFEKYKKWFE